MKKIIAKFENETEQPIEINRFPDTCPLCHHGIDPRFKMAYSEEKLSQAIFQCPRDECHRFFIGYYQFAGGVFFLRNLEPFSHQFRGFSDEINIVSHQFTKIYNEAKEAEEKGLMEICGCGYRKALEFLIKDYAILNSSDETERDEIKKKFLSNVIKEHVTDENIKATAELATWIGNDETHYMRRWTQMDVNDLKTLIELTVRWIESSEMTKSYKARMHND
jgi:hypothetical protein